MDISDSNSVIVIDDDADDDIRHIQTPPPLHKTPPTLPKTPPPPPPQHHTTTADDVACSDVEQLSLSDIMKEIASEMSHPTVEFQLPTSTPADCYRTSADVARDFGTQYSQPAEQDTESIAFRKECMDFGTQYSESIDFGTQYSDPRHFGTQYTEPRHFGTQYSEPRHFGTQYSSSSDIAAQTRLDLIDFGTQFSPDLRPHCAATDSSTQCDATAAATEGTDFATQVDFPCPVQNDFIAELDEAIALATESRDFGAQFSHQADFSAQFSDPFAAGLNNDFGMQFEAPVDLETFADAPHPLTLSAGTSPPYSSAIFNSVADDNNVNDSRICKAPILEHNGTQTDSQVTIEYSVYYLSSY